MSAAATLRMFSRPVPKPPPGLIIVSYGGGLNSVAALVWLERHGLRPHAIVMVDPGSEWKHTHAYRENVLAPWLASVGFPAVELINRIDEGQHVARAWRLETLQDECLRTEALPSAAYGKKKCSAKYKGDTQRWWAKRAPWAQDEWAAGRKLVKVIGYDVDEGGRVLKAFPNEWEAARFVPWYPLHASELSRADCAALVRCVGLPVPLKSACTFCPNNTLEEWERLRRVEPDRFAEAVEMSRRAEPGLESPAAVGLMRCNAAGKRQLHVWAAGGYPDIPEAREVNEADEEDALAAMPCECPQ